MTTFEITIIVLLAAIVVLLIIVFIGMATINARMKEGFQYLGKQVEYCDSKLGYIKGAAQDISQQLNNIENNVLDESVGLSALVNIEKTNQELLMPVIKWQRRLVGADNPACETTDNE